jgi:hypothetical protein
MKKAIKNKDVDTKNIKTNDNMSVEKPGENLVKKRTTPKKWMPEEDVNLMSEYASNKTTSEIALLHNRTVLAIALRLKKLNLINDLTDLKDHKEISSADDYSIMVKSWEKYTGVGKNKSDQLDNIDGLDGELPKTKKVSKTSKIQPDNILEKIKDIVDNAFVEIKVEIEVLKMKIDDINNDIKDIKKKL